MEKIRAVIFDFDGLILDTEGPIFQSWQELYASFGQELLLEDWSQSIGTTETTFDPLVALEERLGCHLNGQIALQRQQRELHLIAGQPVLPGVQAALQDARRLGLKIGLASSSTCTWVTGYLQHLDLLHYFDCLRASDDVAHTKPDPEVYQAALLALGVPPEQAVVFEDSLNGVLAARRAGIFTVAVPNPLTWNMPLEIANLRLESLADMPLADILALAEQSGSRMQPTR